MVTNLNSFPGGTLNPPLQPNLISESLKSFITSHDLFQNVTELPQFNLTQHDYKSLANQGHNADTSLLTRVLRVAQKIIKIASTIFIYFGGFFAIFSLLGIFIDQHPATKLMSVLVGMAFGGGVGLLGLGLRQLIKVLAFCEKKWINSYFQNWSNQNQESQKQQSQNILTDLRKWSSIQSEDLGRVKKIIKTGLEHLSYQKNFFAQDYDENLAKTLVHLHGKIYLFDSAILEFKNILGGKQVLAFLNLKG